ncbi:MAG: hypothetical protein IMW99_03705 [Firmicutes bacterium]|nr:hypothetical protein [Bacillota bacterium]
MVQRAIMLLPLSALAPDGTQEIQILPRGWVKSARGTFLVDDQAVAEILQAFNARQNDIVVDYEHQTLSGAEAPAAGWITRLIDKGPDGLWAQVQWNERARQYIANREYRYLSPVILVRKSDQRAVALHSVGLTNTPAIDGMQPVAAKDSAEEDGNMDFLQKLAAKLGLADKSEAEVLEAVDKLVYAPKQAPAPAEMVAHKELLALMDLPETAGLSEAKAKVLALKNPSGYVRAEEFKTLQDKLAQKERDELVAEALRSGKVAPAQKSWAETYALKDPEGFRTYLASAPVVVPVQPAPKEAEEPARQPDEAQLLVNKMLGISPDSWKKYAE